MAILNFAKTYAEISDKLQLPESNTGDYIKLYFSKDGHIISHGTDYTPTFSGGPRGLVPQSDGDIKKLLRGNGSWAVITTSDLPMATIINGGEDNKTTLMSTKQIVDYIGNSFAANDAMRFKGSIAKTETGFSTTTSQGVVNQFPTKCEIGDTYRISNRGSYFGNDSSIICSTGDLIICIKDGNGPGLNTTEYWAPIEANINGTSITTVNNTQYKFYSPNISDSFEIYAPVTGGTSGQILKSSGNSAPTWINQYEIIAGDIIQSSKQKLLTSVTATNGTISVTVGGTTKSATASGTWNINILGSANSVSQALSAGQGLIMGLTIGEQYDGSEAKTISLLPSSNTSLGGVIIDKNNENKTISVDSDGNIYLTKTNIKNILGFIPSPGLGKNYSNVISNISTGTEQITGQILNPYFNLISEYNEEKSVISSIQFIGQGKTSVFGNANRISIESTWRDIQIGGISIGDKTLNFIPTGDVYLKVDSNGNDIQDLSFGLSWYNISTGEYEYDQAYEQLT